MEIGKGKILIPDHIAQGDVIRVQAVVQHPMDTGFFRDANANMIPPYFMKDVTVTYGEAEVARFEWTSGVSKDPMIAFPLRADREALLTFTYTDNRGTSYQISVPIAFQTG
ncbi:MAG: thiosulfate oxidation carrier complex protein SoxZ [Gemmatimonadota bacterium]